MNRMRRIVYIFVAVLAANCHAQRNKTGITESPTRNISIEVLGVDNLVGINFDSRLWGNRGWGYRVGVGYTHGSQNGYFVENKSSILTLYPGDSRLNGVCLPLEVNYLVGKKRNKLEIGLGGNLGLYHEKYEYTMPTSTAGEYVTRHERDNRFGYFLYGNVGYRFQPVKGFVFRIGITPSFNFGDRHSIDRHWLYPYVGFGYSFHRRNSNE